MTDFDRLNRDGYAMLADFSLAPTTPVRVPTLERYWSDPAFAAECDAERAVGQAKINAHFNAVRDAGLRKAGIL